MRLSASDGGAANLGWGVQIAHPNGISSIDGSRYWKSAFVPSRTLAFASTRPSFGIFSFFGAPNFGGTPKVLEQTSVALASPSLTPSFGF